MKIVRGTPGRPLFENTVVCLGNFDGVHLGHRKIIDRAVRLAADHGLTPVMMTFSRHPSLALGKEPPPSLTTIPEKFAIVSSLGIEDFFLADFDAPFAAMTPVEFVDRILLGTLDARHVVTGFNYRFGRNRLGDVSALGELCAERGIEVHASRPVIVNGGLVSSTAVRGLLAEGRVGEAETFLGRPYAMSGKVVHGHGRGSQMGFPTANIEPRDSIKSIPGDGVYMVGVRIGSLGPEGPGTENGTGPGTPGTTGSMAGAMSVGTNPTFGGEGRSRRTLEVHLPGFEGKLYGMTLEIAFMRRLRDMIKYAGSGELAKQLAKDMESVAGLAEIFRRGGKA